MAKRIAGLGARLRPHVKTHKCIEVGRLQQKHGAQGITAATLVEARDFADAGFNDITWAVPLVAGRLDEVVALAKRITFRVLVESPEGGGRARGRARVAGVRLHTCSRSTVAITARGLIPTMNARAPSRGGSPTARISPSTAS